MPLSLSVVLFVMSLLTLLFILKRIRSSKVRIEDSIFWLLLGVFLLVVSVFPNVFFFAADITGIESASNFVFLFFIFVLLIKCISMSIHISQLDTKVKELAQLLAIEQHERRNMGIEAPEEEKEGNDE